MPKKKAVKKKRGKKVGKNKCLRPPPRQRLPEEQLLSCVRHLISWLKYYQKQFTTALAASFEQPQTGLALWQDFTICLTTMRAPVTTSDLLLLKPLLHKSGLVDITSLNSDLLTHQRRLTLERERVTECEICDVCGLRLPPQSFNDPCSSYVELYMMLAPFASLPDHPGHITYLIPTSTTVHTLHHQLHSSLGTMATAVAVFSDVKVQPSNCLSPQTSLNEMGVVGGRKTTPTKATLYYDYKPVSIDCPLIMTDYYYYHQTFSK